MQKIIIIGGAGYVGTMLAQYLINEFEVTVYDLFIYGDHIQNQKVKKIKGDVRDLDNLKMGLKNQDIVVHLACISNDPSFDLDPKLGKSINFDSFRPILEECENNKIQKFLFVSSSSVYGSRKEDLITENLSKQPQTDYAKYKSMCEDVLLDFNNSFIKTIIRPSTLCGYSKRQRLDLTVNIFTNQAINQNKITIHGGSQMRPALHIQDMTNFLIFLLEANDKKINNQIFNISRENFTILDIAKRIIRILKTENTKIIIEELIDNRSYRVCSDKLENELGFKLKYSIEDAVIELKNAFDRGLLKNSLQESKFFNIKKMKEIDLK